MAVLELPPEAPFFSEAFYLAIHISYRIQWISLEYEDTWWARDEQFLSLLEGGGIGDISTTGVYTFPERL